MLNELADEIREINRQNGWNVTNLRYPIAAHIIKSPYLADRIQVRFPRSKKKRIRKKWARDPRNYRMVPKNDVYLFDGRLVMHPELAAKLTDEMTRRAMDRLESTILGY